MDDTYSALFAMTHILITLLLLVLVIVRAFVTKTNIINNVRNQTSKAQEILKSRGFSIQDTGNRKPTQNGLHRTKVFQGRNLHRRRDQSGSKD